jgi:hypothetical protein
MHVIFLSMLGALFLTSSVDAASLQIQPTLYKDISLKKGEKSKGFVDISNPTANKQEVTLSVQGYKQIDSTGALTFFDDEAIKRGVKLDLDNFELGPHDSIRVYFQLDGSLLPSGDVFAAIFARTIPAEGTVAQAVQVGTLLVITNGTPPSHKATIAELSAPLFHWGDSIDATMVVTNPAEEGSATGFFPKIFVDLQPYSSKTVDGPLVFAGNSRSISYTQKGNYFGIMRLQVKTNADSKSTFLFAVTGFWRWLAPLILVSIILAIFFMRQQRRKTRKK